MSTKETNIYISGQVSCDDQLNVIGEGDLEIQVDQALKNLRTAIKAAGGTMDDIISLRIYVVDYSREDSEVISQALLRFFDRNCLPAATWISVVGLANPAFMIEIEAQAAI